MVLRRIRYSCSLHCLTRGSSAPDWFLGFAFGHATHTRFLTCSPLDTLPSLARLHSQGTHQTPMTGTQTDNNNSRQSLLISSDVTTALVPGWVHLSGQTTERHAPWHTRHSRDMQLHAHRARRGPHGLHSQLHSQLQSQLACTISRGCLCTGHAQARTHARTHARPLRRHARPLRRHAG